MTKTETRPQVGHHCSDLTDSASSMTGWIFAFSTTLIIELSVKVCNFTASQEMDLFCSLTSHNKPASMSENPSEERNCLKIYGGKSTIMYTGYWICLEHKTLDFIPGCRYITITSHPIPFQSHFLSCLCSFAFPSFMGSLSSGLLWSALAKNVGFLTVMWYGLPLESLSRKCYRDMRS